MTTFNSESVVSENRLTVIPNAVNFDIASLLGCSVTTALGLINNEAKAKIGESILIIGSGSVGLSLVQASNLVSCYPIVTCDIQEDKLIKSMELGATNTINIQNENQELVEKSKKLIGNNGYDIIVDTTGIPELIDLAYNLLSSQGRLIMVGQPKKGEKIVLNSASDNFTGKTIFDSQGGKTNPDIDIRNYLKIIQNNKIDIEKIITKRINIKDINSTIEDIKKHKVIGKVIINF